MEVLNKEHDKKYKDAMEEWERARKNWWDRYADKWVKYAEAVIEQIQQRGEPITDALKGPRYDLDDRKSWTGPAYFVSLEKPMYESFKPKHLDELAELKSVLQADDGQKVSQAALERMGFRKLREYGLFKS
jgi:uncharacterized protein HemX